MRKALQLAINSKEIGDKLFGGYGGPYALHTVRPTESFFDPNRIKIDPFDPQGAKKLLAEAGYPNGFDTKLWDIGGGSILSNVNAAIAGYLGNIGIKAAISPIEFSAFRPMWATKLDPKLWGTMYSNRSQITYGFGSFPLFYHSRKAAPHNANDPKVDQLIDAALAAKDNKERDRLKQEASVLAKQNYTTLPIVEVKGIFGVSTKIGEVGNVDMSTESMPARSFESIGHAK